MKYYIRYEKLNGSWYYMIYRKFFFGHLFMQRLNTPEQAIERLNELKEE